MGVGRTSLRTAQGGFGAHLREVAPASGSSDLKKVSSSPAPSVLRQGRRVTVLCALPTNTMSPAKGAEVGPSHPARSAVGVEQVSAAQLCQDVIVLEEL